MAETTMPTGRPVDDIHRDLLARQPAHRISPLWTDILANAAQASLYARSLGIHVPHDTWTGMSTNEATCLIDPGDSASVRLLYAWSPSRLSATQQCRYGRWHLAPVHSPADVTAFVAAVADCSMHSRRAFRAQALGDALARVTPTRLSHRPKEHPPT